jgi:hypothetical protein
MITSKCTKRYVIKADIEAASPTISTGKIPEITAQNSPRIKHEFYIINELKQDIPLMIVEIQGVWERILAKNGGSKPSLAIA